MGFTAIFIYVDFNYQEQNDRKLSVRASICLPILPTVHLSTKVLLSQLL